MAASWCACACVLLVHPNTHHGGLCGRGILGYVHVVLVLILVLVLPGASAGARSGASCWWSAPHFVLICHLMSCAHFANVGGLMCYF